MQNSPIVDALPISKIAMFHGYASLSLVNWRDMLNYWRVYGYSIYNITQFFWLGDLWPSLSPTQQFCRLRGSTCLPICRQSSSTLAPWHPKCCWPVGLLVHTYESTKLRITPFSTWLICATMLLYWYCLLIWSLTMSPWIYVRRFNVQLCPWWSAPDSYRHQQQPAKVQSWAYVGPHLQ